MYDIPQISEDDIKELVELSQERQQEIELEQEIEEYMIQQLLKDEELEGDE